ncbi:hypothetical protein PR202_ga29827 [Eleusine coracana subsp. coracana]|uniref:Uncharacterized protein n=1 Tax=Eleusine coracana subsp. coracana TaxID=191504 RepID=A0AAV5DN50_ELECO|nr:hypothetical protein PR202_ga29827 [Eleusine coracana subsp. coracana]
MGNCLERSRRGRAGGAEHWANKRAVWAEEKVIASEKEEEEEETCKGESEPPAPATDQVKIRITRKQLEELLRRVDDGNQDGGVPVREVISELLCDASSSSVQHRGEQGQWRPSLQSIPE